ncbi:MAG: hypothetical protein DWQ30_20745 [Acidobacteria bacterium]|nr:MAG: hypothetical protein DWQ30_20745 [Acidobacteriota bacterium]
MSISRIGPSTRAMRRLYAALLWLLPGRLRRDSGDEMLRLFGEMAYRAEMRTGWLGVTAFTLRAALDLSCTAARLRIERWTGGWRQSVSGRGGPAAGPRRSQSGREAGRGSRGGDGMLERVLRNLRVSIRQIRRRPLLPAVGVATVAIGIGASVAIFGVVYGVLLKPLGLESPHELVNLRQVHRANPHDAAGLSPSVYHHLREQVTEAHLAAWYYDSVTLEAGGAYRGTPVELANAIVGSTDLFDLLGIQPLRGRVFAPDDAPPRSGRGSVAVISEELFERAFGGDEAVLGSGLRLDGELVRVVGVVSSVPPAPIAGVELWLCDGFRVDDRALTRRLLPIARLGGGATEETLSAELDRLYAGIAEEDSRLAEWTAAVSHFREDLLGAVARGLWLGFAGILLLLVLASANFANLMVTRLTVRRGELRTRATLGATRTALLAQQLVEGTVLALAGGAVGVAVAWLLQRELLHLAEGLLPRVSEVRLDLPVLGFALALSLAVGTGCTLGAALVSLRGVGARQRPSAREEIGGQRTRSGLAAAQVALALVLLAAGALLVQSFRGLAASDPGYDVDSVAVARIYVDDRRYADLEDEKAYFERLLERLESLPGVVRAATTTSLPMDPDTLDYDVPYRRADLPEEPGADAGEQAFFRLVSPGYFEALGMELVTGRTFDDRDHGGPPTVVVNETMARRVWPEGAATRGSLVVPAAGRDPFEVVGVVADASFATLGAPPKPEMYFVKQRYSLGGRSLVLRTSVDPETLLAPMRAAALEFDPSQPLNLATTLSRLSRSSVAAERFQSWIASITASLALLLSITGIYAIVAFWVGQSRFEIGLRMAVGASRVQIANLVLGRGVRVAAWGVGIGLLLAAVTLPGLRSLLHGVEWFEPSVLGSVALLLTLAALVASVAPARSASRIDPYRALRRD